MKKELEKIELNDIEIIIQKIKNIKDLDIGLKLRVNVFEKLYTNGIKQGESINNYAPYLSEILKSHEMSLQIEKMKLETIALRKERGKLEKEIKKRQKENKQKSTKTSIPLLENTIGRNRTQLSLFDMLNKYPSIETENEIIGAEFSLSEHRVLFAIQTVLSSRNDNNKDLIMSTKEFLNAFGVERYRDKNNKLRTIKNNAIDTLKTLAGKPFIFEYKNIYIAETFFGIGIDKQTITLKLHDIFFDSYYIFLPSNLNIQIKNIYPRATHFYTFIMSLIFYYKANYKIIKKNNWNKTLSYNTIIDRSRLNYLQDSRQKKRLVETINKFFIKAIELKMITSFEETTTTIGEKGIKYTYNDEFFPSYKPIINIENNKKTPIEVAKDTYWSCKRHLLKLQAYL